MDDEREARKYRVEMRSVPGMYAQYDGHVDVWAYDDRDAEERAFMRLRRESFPDRGRDCWRVVSVSRRD